MRKTRFSFHWSVEIWSGNAIKLTCSLNCNLTTRSIYMSYVCPDCLQVSPICMHARRTYWTVIRRSLSSIQGCQTQCPIIPKLSLSQRLALLFVSTNGIFLSFFFFWLIIKLLMSPTMVVPNSLVFINKGIPTRKNWKLCYSVFFVSLFT